MIVPQVSQSRSAEVDYVLQTKDFRFIDREGLFNTIYTTVKGENILFEYSVDSGASWQTWGTITNSATFQAFKLNDKVTTQKIRFRISGTGGGFGIQRFAFKYRPTKPIE